MVSSALAHVHTVLDAVSTPFCPFAAYEFYGFSNTQSIMRLLETTNNGYIPRGVAEMRSTGAQSGCINATFTASPRLHGENLNSINNNNAVLFIHTE
jgi:hypothetical protein